MTNKQGNEPAFPSPTERGPDGIITSYSFHGMSLRDYFAGQVIIALIQRHGDDESPSCTLEENSEMAYWYADAMLKERLR